MVASVLGKEEDARIVNIPLSGDMEATYGIYYGKKLTKLVALNLWAHNATHAGTRPSRDYEFLIPGNQQRARVERLIAPGSDSVEGVTFGGISYDYERKGGKPVVVNKSQEILEVKKGLLRVGVPDSSAVLVSLV